MTTRITTTDRTATTATDRTSTGAPHPSPPAGAALPSPSTAVTDDTAIDAGTSTESPPATAPAVPDRTELAETEAVETEAVETDVLEANAVDGSGTGGRRFRRAPVPGAAVSRPASGCRPRGSSVRPCSSPCGPWRPPRDNWIPARSPRPGRY